MNDVLIVALSLLGLALAPLAAVEVPKLLGTTGGGRKRPAGAGRRPCPRPDCPSCRPSSSPAAIAAAPPTLADQLAVGSEILARYCPVCEGWRGVGSCRHVEPGAPAGTMTLHAAASAPGLRGPYADSALPPGRQPSPRAWGAWWAAGGRREAAGVSR